MKKLLILLSALVASFSTLRASSLEEQLRDLLLSESPCSIIVGPDGAFLGTVNVEITREGVSYVIIQDEIIVRAETPDGAAIIIEDYLPCEARLVSKKDYDRIDAAPEE